MYIHQFLLVHNVDYPTPEEFETRENVSNEETPTCSSQEAMEVCFFLCLLVGYSVILTHEINSIMIHECCRKTLKIHCNC